MQMDPIKAVAYLWGDTGLCPGCPPFTNRSKKCPSALIYSIEHIILLLLALNRKFWVQKVGVLYGDGPPQSLKGEGGADGGFAKKVLKN
jgi:hypothetical protein